jgi:hypothetical protein
MPRGLVCTVARGVQVPQDSSPYLTLAFENQLLFVRFEVFTAVTTTNGVFWNVTPCGSCKNRRFGGT